MFDPTSKLFDVEHALMMHAHSYATLPAAGIYDGDQLVQIEYVTKKCHIYFVGLTPRIEVRRVIQKGRVLSIAVTLYGKEELVDFKLPKGMMLVDSDRGLLVNSIDNTRHAIDLADISRALGKKLTVSFDVLYIGQAYGSDGNRNAIDRLKKHETLQKISLKGVPTGMELSLLLLEIVPANRLFTVINPFARNKDESGDRIKAGVEKLHGTSESERVSLYEASMIRYFMPRFNIEFKESFPSTNLKVLRDCYDKDFSAVVAEICFDDLPWRLKSDVVLPAFTHVAKHRLHTAKERDLFFL